MLYHTKLGLPKNLKLPKLRKKVVYTNHAKQAAHNDRYGNFAHFLPLHNHFDPKAAELVEVESPDGVTATKMVYRLPLAPNSKNDLVLALIPFRDYYLAKTVWLNEHSDKHTTLNLKRYAKP